MIREGMIIAREVIRKKRMADKEDEEKEAVKEDGDKKFLIDEKEIEQIKDKYLGVVKEKQKPIVKQGDKFKQVFNFEWDNKEDTSVDINPLYAKKYEAKLLFGKGFKGGADQDE